MKQKTKTIAAVISGMLFLLISACTTIKPIELTEQTSYAKVIAVGDKVRLLYLDERIKEIRVTEISEQAITGKLESGAVVIADWRDIYEAERIQISPIKTAGAAVGIAIAVPILAVLAVMSGCVTAYC